MATPLTAERPINARPRRGLRPGPIAADTVVYGGSACCYDLDGYVVPAASVPGYRMAGFARDSVDNTGGAAGALNVDLEDSIFEMDTSDTLAQDDVGKPVFLVSDHEFTLTKGPVRMGTLDEVVSASLGMIDPGPLPVPNSPESDEITRTQLFDCEDDAGGETAVDIIPAAFSSGASGMFLDVHGVVVEEFAGAGQDQGVITVYDEDDSALTTVTVADGGADAIGDIRDGARVSSLSAGDAMVDVAAGKAVYAKVTQPTTGAGAAGKIALVVRAVRY